MSMKVIVRTPSGHRLTHTYAGSVARYLNHTDIEDTDLVPRTFWESVATIEGLSISEWEKCVTAAVWAPQRVDERVSRYKGHCAVGNEDTVIGCDMLIITVEEQA